ncbi:hypothetical protein DY037_08495 [Apilactobacillus micheneri]|nr:hypothetical protein DYZ97_07240 [Apilactobacillus timberlakei]TPR47013.1 hypothetical protein DY037_08495 [Apilactobacillus micheneri]
MKTKSEILRELKDSVDKYDRYLRISLSSDKRAMFISRDKYPVAQINSNCIRCAGRYPFSFDLLQLLITTSKKLIQEK